jgi:hypothetical protein
MKYFPFSFITALFILGLSAYSSAHAASDWTIPANPACEVILGTATNVRSGYKASSGVAVIHCDLTKKVASNNLNYVFARINRNSSSSNEPFCTLNSHSAYNTSNNTTTGYPSTGAGNRSISIPIPTSYSNGYLTVTCILNNNDSLYGIRYGQD